MIDRFLDCVGRHPRAVLAASCLLLTALAWHNRFIQDDAFISFQYAANLVAGHGLTWIPGERVEGYTNFLWTLIIAGALRLGLEPIGFSQGLGIVLFAGSLVMTERLAGTLLGSRPLALLAVWLLGTHYTFSAYATGGLETQLETFLVITLVALAWRTTVVDDRHARRLLGLSLLAAAALLTRLDAAIPIVVLAVVLLGRLARSPGPRAIAAAALVLPALLIVGAWLFWKLGYYGDLLPNTFYAKTGAVAAIVQGIKYLYVFVESYWLAPFVFGLLLSVPAMARRSPGLAMLLAIVILWCGYVVQVGGDFMEFRLLVPILPLLMIFAAWMIREVRPRAAQVALVAVMIAGSFVHSWRFGPTPTIDSVPELARYIEDREQGWVTAGRVLGEMFGGADPPVRLATTAAGAIPYYSKLPTLDMHGLTDRWIARHGWTHATPRPAHQRSATLEDLLRHRVNLVIGHPWVHPLAAVPRYRFGDFVVVNRRDDLIPAAPRFMIVPLNARYCLTVLELVPSAAVSHVIAQRGLATYPALGP